MSDDPSFTVVLPAILRAVHQIIDHDPKILTDPVAVGLVDGSSEAEILTRADEFRAPGLKRLRSSFVMRSRYVEDILAEVAGHIRQFVILGAGLDTFAYRQPVWATQFRIFEVDRAATQRWKMERLASAGIEAPPNVTFVAADFERSSLASALDAAAFDRTAPTLFSCLGVTQYLTEQAIHETLGYVASLPRGSEIVFSFVLPGATLSSADATTAAVASSSAGSRGEPWITRLDVLAWYQLLLRLGFSRTFHLTPVLAERRYYRGRTDGLPVPVLSQLMRATV